MKKTKEPWFVKVGPTGRLFPANIYGFLYSLLGIGGGIGVAKLALTYANSGPEWMPFLLWGGFALYIVVFVRVAYLKAR